MADVFGSCTLRSTLQRCGHPTLHYGVLVALAAFKPWPNLLTLLVVRVITLRITSTREQQRVSTAQHRTAPLTGLELEFLCCLGLLQGYQTYYASLRLALIDTGQLLV